MSYYSSSGSDQFGTGAFKVNYNFSTTLRSLDSFLSNGISHSRNGLSESSILCSGHLLAEGKARRHIFAGRRLCASYTSQDERERTRHPQDANRKRAPPNQPSWLGTCQQPRLINSDRTVCLWSISLRIREAERVGCTKYVAHSFRGASIFAFRKRDRIRFNAMCDPGSPL